MRHRLWQFVVPSALALGLAGCAGGRDSLESTAQEKPEELAALVDEIVTDDDRNAQAKSLLSELDRTIQIYFQQVEEVQLATIRTGLFYDASAGDLEAAQSNLKAARTARRDDIIRLAMEARQVLTADEWEELAKRRLERMRKAEGGTR